MTTNTVKKLYEAQTYLVSVIEFGNSKDKNVNYNTISIQCSHMMHQLQKHCNGLGVRHVQ